MEKEKLRSILAKFDFHKEYLDAKIERDIAENRQGQFVLDIKNEKGEPVGDALVKVRQISHEFKFGCSLFYLGQFPDEERNEKYRNLFKNVFNYAVVPLYWDTLEPEEGKPRFSADSAFVSRRPPIDTIMEFCEENGIETKGHCLVYNSFQPDWLPESNREIKIKLERRIRDISERYGNRISDFDVINEMLTIYKNCYKASGWSRNLQITDELDHEKQSFELCRRYFPHSRLFWNEGIDETFGEHYRGHRSFYYMTLEKMLSMGVPIEGIGMQYHAYDLHESTLNPLRLIDAFDCYGKFGLPIHLSEVSLPSFGNESENEALQAELTEWLFKLWFSTKNCEAIVWWNLADNTAFGNENRYHAGLIRNDCTVKPAYNVIDRLINKEWRTELEKSIDSQLRFSGYYGDYEIEIKTADRTAVKKVRLHKENTGYDNRLCDFRHKEIII